MKRRNRKQKLKTAKVTAATIPGGAEKAVGPFAPLGASTDLAGAGDPTAVGGRTDDAGAFGGAEYVIDLSEEFIGAGEAEKSHGPSVALAEAVRESHRGEEFPAPVEEKSAGPSVAPAEVALAGAALSGADRRTHPRYEFIAAGEVVAAESGARIETRVRDVSQQGCYVDTSDALPLGTVTGVRITKGAQLFEARARVVYSRAGKGMGLVFTEIEPERHRTLETWIAESRETSWLAANRRRSQRVLMTVPIRVSGQRGAGLAFEEETHTRAISAHGALILVSTEVHRGQRLTLSNVQTKAALECVVAHIDRKQSAQPQVGVEFALPNPTFWHVVFPPKDWTPKHPHAKSRVRVGESN